MTRAAAFATLLVIVLAVAARLEPVREGLTATYYANTVWSGPPIVSTRDPQPGNEGVRAAFRGTLPAQFSATWAGSLLAMRDGPYALATLSSGVSAVFVDGELIVDNGGARDSPRGATGLVTLSRGVHAIYVRDAHAGGPFHFELLWARAGEPLERVPGWALTPRRADYWAFALSAALRQSLAAAQWLWVGVLSLWALSFAWSGVRRLRGWLAREEAWPLLKWVLAGSLVLNAAGLWWGLPGGSWAPDELSPILVMEGLARSFAHGWFDRYPPFHFYILTIAFSPMLVLEWLGRLDLTAAPPYNVLVVISRLVSLALSSGTLVAIYVCGARTFGTRAGILAAAMFALLTPFVYYAKTANLDAPYVFWFALSMVCYLRALDDLKARDLIGFAVCATLAICTKDQAYGLYLFAPAAFVFRLWQVNRAAGQPAPFVRAIGDVRLWSAALVAVMLFALTHNLAFNAAGFAEHVRYITGGGSETYRDFEPTLAGRLALLRFTADVTRAAWGWPLFIVSLLGGAFALVTPRYRLAVLWLALPVLSYYLGFINVVLYNYDRFMLPVCLVLSLFGGLMFDQWLGTTGKVSIWRTTGVAAVFAFSSLYAASVDLAMLRDSRYVMEQWLVARVTPGDLVGLVFPEPYYPRLDRFHHREIGSIEQLQQERPSFYLLNADYGRAEPPDTRTGQLIAGLQNGQLGYELVFRFRQPNPWPWLPGMPRDLVGDRKERPVSSVLRQINPWYEVFKQP